MKNRASKRFWQIGCLAASLLAATIFIWVFISTNQIPTTSIATQRTVFVLHGPLRPNDEGVKDVWEALINKWQNEGVIGRRVLKWLGIPRELTVAFYDAQTSPLATVAINFRKGFRWLWLLLRILGKRYKGAHYLVLSHGLVVGMYGGTVIVAKDKVIFCHIVDNLVRGAKSEGQTLKLTRKLREQNDFFGFIRPQFIPASEHAQLPAGLGEIELDIVNTNELRGSVFWVCQDEREAKALVLALERIEKEMTQDCARKNVQCSFHKWREGMFVWWEFRLNNFMFLLF